MNELWLENVECEGIEERRNERKKLSRCENDMWMDGYGVMAATEADGGCD